jgi:hypothetical protein
MLPISAKFTAIVMGHGLTRPHLHKFKIIPTSTCPYRLKEEETTDHIILNCKQLENERRILRNAIV